MPVCRGGLADLLWWFEDVDAVLGPQLGDGLASPFGVRFDPHRHLAVGQLLGVDHNVLLLLSWVFAAPTLPSRFTLRPPGCWSAPFVAGAGSTDAAWHRRPDVRLVSRGCGMLPGDRGDGICHASVAARQHGPGCRGCRRRGGAR